MKSIDFILVGVLISNQFNLVPAVDEANAGGNSSNVNL